MNKIICLSALFLGVLLSYGVCLADGVFVFRWNKNLDINEPTQKAIILHDQGREDLVLQVKYEGPAEEFGWLVPVPDLPEVRKGSMDCFYELSQFTQRQFAAGPATEGVGLANSASPDENEPVKVIKIQTVGAYEVAVLATDNAAKLTEWLDANGFSFPKEKQNVLDGYIAKHWYFVAIKIDPEKNGFVVRQGSPKSGVLKNYIPPTTRKKLANGELHPLVLSFAADKCVFPLAISSINGKPSEISLYVLSAEPLMSRVIFDKQFTAYTKARTEWLTKEPERRKEREERMKAMDAQRETQISALRERLGGNSALASHRENDDPADPQPPMSKTRELLGMVSYPLLPGVDMDYPDDGPMLWSMPAGAKDFSACAKELPRLAGKTWWVTKQVQTFAPDEMQDLEFEPAVPFLTDLSRTPDGAAQAFACLRQFGSRAVPAVVAGMESKDSEERRQASYAATQMRDPKLAPAAVKLLNDENLRTRVNACYAIDNNWDDKFTPLMVEKLSDSGAAVRTAALQVLRVHPNEAFRPIYRKLLAEDSVAAAGAIQLAGIENYSRAEQIRFFSSTNLPVVSTAFTRLRYSLTLDEVAPLLTNPIPTVRMMGLGELQRISTKPAMDQMVAMLHDTNEIVRWRVRFDLRRLTSQKLGADPAAYEQWWKQNRETFTPPPPSDTRRPRADVRG